jgi:hypothetical protein
VRSIVAEILGQVATWSGHMTHAVTPIDGAHPWTGPRGLGNGSPEQRVKRWQDRSRLKARPRRIGELETRGSGATPFAHEPRRPDA